MPLIFSRNQRSFFTDSVDLHASPPAAGAGVRADRSGTPRTWTATRFRYNPRQKLSRFP